MSGIHTDRIRFANSSDAPGIAALHAESWRRHYRGAYSDAFLDGDVATDRQTVWIRQLSNPPASHCTLVAEDGDVLVGFAHSVFDDDPTWGALLDNLHVVFALKRNGIGTSLLTATARTVVARAPDSGLYLWVLEQNTTAQAFYEARGGKRVDRRLVSPPGGDPSRLSGTPSAFRYAWPEPSTLLIA
jgi:ribosomal protein S18 acetylase RimI-like enzyme